MFRWAARGTSERTTVHPRHSRSTFPPARGFVQDRPESRTPAGRKGWGRASTRLPPRLDGIASAPSPRMARVFRRPPRGRLSREAAARWFQLVSRAAAGRDRTTRGVRGSPVRPSPIWPTRTYYRLADRVCARARLQPEIPEISRTPARGPFARHPPARLRSRKKKGRAGWHAILRP